MGVWPSEKGDSETGHVGRDPIRRFDVDHIGDLAPGLGTRRGGQRPQRPPSRPSVSDLGQNITAIDEDRARLGVAR